MKISYYVKQSSIVNGVPNNQDWVLKTFRYILDREIAHMNLESSFYENKSVFKACHVSKIFGK